MSLSLYLSVSVCVRFIGLRDCASVLVSINACACVCFVDLKKEKIERD